MTRHDKNHERRRQFWPGLGHALATLGGLAFCYCAGAQVTVDTIGGGVRAECGPSYGFASGNTYSQAQFNGPVSCALDTNGNLWIADKTNNDLEQISEAGNKAASVTTQYYDVTGTAKHYVTNYHFFTNITGVAVDPANNLYVLLPSPLQVYQCSLTAQSASLNVSAALFLTNVPSGVTPTAMTVDASSNVFLAFSNGVIIRFPLLGSNPPPAIYSNNFALGASASVHYIVTSFSWSPAGLALLANGQLAVSDTLRNAIWVVSTNDYGANTGPHLLTGSNGAGYDDGGSSFAQFDQPRGLAASADGRLIVCDTMNNRLRVIDTYSNTTTLYGTASNVWTGTCCACSPDTYYAGWVDGAAGTGTSNAAGRLPVSVALAPSGTLFVTELYYSLIRQVTGATFTPVNLSATYATSLIEPASGITATNAALNGFINAGGQPTYYYFAYGANTSLTNFTATNLLTTNLTATQPVSATILNLLPDTTYYYELVAYNGLGAVYSSNSTLATPAEAPVVETQPAANVTYTTAVLRASVNPEYSQTEVVFQWGASSTNLANTTAPIVLTNNLTANQTVTSALSNLQSGTIYYFQVVAYNSGGSGTGSALVFETPYLPPPTLSFSPSNGYFPDCVSIAVTSSLPAVYYTTNGALPTTNSAELFLTNSGSPGEYSGSLEWCNPQLNLSSLVIMAGVSSNNSTVLQGGYPATNSVGFPQALSAGPGGHLYVPVVVELQSNTALESLQFRVEITPSDTNAPMMETMSLQPLTPNDLVLLPGPAPDNAPVSFVTFAYTNGSTLGMVVTAEGSSGLDMQGSGVVVVLHLAVPANAPYGLVYSLNVLDPSGTSDGQQNIIGLNSLAAQTLTINDPPYLVGDSSPSTGYNAGQFGNGALDNADVNNAIYASVNIRVPPADSDLFNSMDAWPPDSAGHGGDGFIRLLDWETILARSLGGVAIYPGLDTNNYIRFWTNGDIGSPSHSVVDWYPGGPAVPLSLDSPATPDVGSPSKLALTNTPPGLVWFCEASVGSGTIIDALPGNTCSLPVYANVLPGYSLAGLQFRTIVTGSGGAPAVTTNWFTPTAGVAAPLVLPGLVGNDKVQAWSFGSFAAPLQNSNFLGTVSFQVPPGAAAGACYTLHFSGVDGAPNFSTAYQLESHPGYVWIMSAAQQAASVTSDEWKTAFFGSLTNTQAGDDADPDGDGAPNWQEYLAGTNPTNALSRLKFSGANLNAGGQRGVAINWLTAPGKAYILQSSPVLGAANWTSVNTNTGDGNAFEYTVTNLSGGAHFYRIRLQP